MVRRVCGPTHGCLASRSRSSLKVALVWLGGSVGWCIVVRFLDHVDFLGTGRVKSGSVGLGYDAFFRLITKCLSRDVFSGPDQCD